MIISDLNVLEVVEAVEVVGGTFSSGNNFLSTYNQTDKINITYTTQNNFVTTINAPLALGNSASAGAKGDAINPYPFLLTSSFTKADTLAVTQVGGGSFSGSTSVAVINPV
ncbi:hypothetical protein NIES4071_90380 [Calothrix sp. NIES-4071]|nr:hypothetical protein NIES4071_90380 [Calothrix sp. NIES-4071]BAZ63305.1 hypothetical protein NIES4105_90310 [Calothrix sp. NIES-4105]